MKLVRSGHICDILELRDFKNVCFDFIWGRGERRAKNDSAILPEHRNS